MSTAQKCERCREYNAAAVDFRNQAANAQAALSATSARHTALVEAVTRLQKLDRDRPLHPVTDGRLIEARTEVDRLLAEGEG